jgi:3-oxoacyl-[acyl-carrier protein] reductase
LNLELDQTVSVIAGGSRGIGRATAEAFLDEGARVLISARDESRLSAVHGALAARFDETVVATHAGDVGDRSTAETVVETAYEKWGRLDTLVLNAGSGSGIVGFNPGAEEWDRLLATNLRGAVTLAEAALPRMLDAGRGSLVFVGSVASGEDVGAPLPYAAAKAALTRYAAGLAREIGPRGLRVNCVAPGNVLTSGGPWERRLVDDPEDLRALLDREVPLGRLGRPEEIAAVIVFLSSAAASFVTGSVVTADGGQTRGY